MIVAVVSFSSCGGGQSAKDVAERFLYLYLIEINQEKAKTLTSGLAESKLEEEIESLRSIRSMDIDLSQYRPFIDYSLLKSEERGPDRVMLLYEVTIKPGDENIEERKERFLISTVREEGQWVVDNFENFR
jgi:hypothetical protein